MPTRIADRVGLVVGGVVETSWHRTWSMVPARPSSSQMGRMSLPRDRGHLALLHDSFSYLRRFVPDVLDAIDFHGTDTVRDLISAVDVLRRLYAVGARRVPSDAPTSFVPARWRGYLDAAAEAGKTTAYRHYWELCVLYGLRDGFRGGACTCRARAAMPTRPAI